MDLVNDKFSKLNNLYELRYAYIDEHITGKQYYLKYKQITSNFTVNQFVDEVLNCRLNDAPLVIQWYVVSSIIKRLGYDSLSSYNYVSGDLYNIRTLLEFLGRRVYLKDVVIKKAEEKICSVLSDRERWTLFEENIVQSPGIRNIRKHLDHAYKKKISNKELFNHACFQDVMLSDVDSIDDIEVKLFIADNLDQKHQYLMWQKTSGFLKLYLWQKQPLIDYDWNLIKSHYHELSTEIQIRVFRFIFGEISSGELSLSVDDLYSVFVKTTTPACPVICAILFILKVKKLDINVSVTSFMIESIIKEDESKWFDFLINSKEFFYPCNGYLAISGNKYDVECQLFNGVLTKESKNNELYYVIKFYDSPVDLYGRIIEWWDDEDIEIAQQVLLKNLCVEIVDDKYYIKESDEFFVKQFVIAYYIDDKCGLMSDKQKMIELGYLPKYSVYQPLYTNYLRKYEDSYNFICRGGCYGDSDPDNNIPFFWCNKKVCVRRAHFLLPPTQWEEYRFADLLFITLGQTYETIDFVWRVNSEISQFIYNCVQMALSQKKGLVISKTLNELEERGVWNETLSTYRDIYDNNEEDDEDEDYEDCLDDYLEDNESTYDRYNGSYAQDEMGYSDDDIDTIFDGDPDAYWNID